MGKQQTISFTEFFFHYVYGGFSSKVTFMVVADTIPSWGSDLKPLTPYLSVGGGELIDGRLPENHSKQCYPCSCMGTKWLQLCPTFCDCGLQPSRLVCPRDSPGKNAGVGCHALLQGIFPTQGLNPASSPSLQADSLPSEPPGKPKNTGEGCLSLLQQIFPTQELNQGLLHCRWIFYQLRYQGGPVLPWSLIK